MILLRDLNEDVDKYIDKDIEVAGWIRNSR